MRCRPDGDRRPSAVGALSPESGVSLVEVAIVLTILASLSGLAMPVTVQAVEERRARHAAGFVAARLRDARQHALYGARTTGLVFEDTTGRWTFRTCQDGNGDGLRRADVRSGVDACDPAQDLAMLFPGVEIRASSSIPAPEREPGSSDPVRFGASDIASFSPEGGCTAGSLTIRSRGGTYYLVRVGNVTGRIRVLRYNAASSSWLDL